MLLGHFLVYKHGRHLSTAPSALTMTCNDAGSWLNAEQDPYEAPRASQYNASMPVVSLISLFVVVFVGFQHSSGRPPSLTCTVRACSSPNSFHGSPLRKSSRTTFGYEASNKICKLGTSSKPAWPHTVLLLHNEKEATIQQA